MRNDVCLPPRRGRLRDRSALTPAISTAILLPLSWTCAMRSREIVLSLRSVIIFDSRGGFDIPRWDWTCSMYFRVKENYFFERMEARFNQSAC